MAPRGWGHASLAIHSFETLAGTLDGLSSAGLVVSILADEEALAELGTNLEPHPGPAQVIGLHELAVMRLLLDVIGADPLQRNLAAGITSRTVWHSLYDQQAGAVEFSFYLGEETHSGGARRERRSDYLKFAIGLEPPT
jgi:hypothetical protein